MSKNRKIVVDDHTTNLVDWHAERLANKGCVVAGRPNFHAARDKLTANLDPGLAEIGRLHAGANFDSQIDKLLQRARLPKVVAVIVALLVWQILGSGGRTP